MRYGSTTLKSAVTPEPGTERYERALGVLRGPNILERAAQDMERLGHVGEPTAKKLLFVCAVSAKAGLPIQPAIHAESSAGKNHLADTVLSAFPPEMVISRTAVSGKALFYTDEDLRGRVIYLQEVVGSEDADFAIRVLQSAQYIEYEVTEKTADGSFRTVTYRKEGPVVVVQTTTAIRLFHENDTRVFPIYVDESPEQTRRIVEHAKLLAATGGLPLEQREAIYATWHDAIRLLEPAEVIVPYATRIEVPSHRVRVRRDINRFLDVIRVVAWLNQHNRERDRWDRVLATEEDFDIAAELVADPLQRAWKSLTPAEQAVMEAIASMRESLRNNGFTRNDLDVEGHDKRRVQDALKALTETGYLERDGRRGPRGYRYTVPRTPEKGVPGLYLRPEGNADEDGRDEDPQRGPAQGRDLDEEEDEGERGSRGIARIGESAIESPLSPGKDAIARSRGVDDEGYFEDGEPEEEEEMDCLGELTERGWYRAQPNFVADDSPEDASLGDDPVAEALRRRIPIFHGGQEKLRWYGGDDTPLVLSAEEALALEPDGSPSGSWPTTPEEMSTRLRRAVHLLQRDAQEFYDPSFDEWCFEARVYASADSPKRYKAAYLHAEVWRNEATGEELWVLVALREGWRVPYREIEEAVWSSTTPGGTTDKIDPEASNHPFEF